MERNKVKPGLCKIPTGNDFQLYIRVEKPNYETGETIWEPFDLSVCKNITVQLLNEPRNIYIPLEWTLDDEDTSKIIANVEGLSLTPGSSYGMQITGIDSDGNNFRWKARGREMFSAVDATNDANLNEDLMDYLDVKVRIGFEYASEIFATKEELNVVSGEVDDLTTEVGDLTTEVGDLDTDVSNLDTKVSGFQSAIETNTQNIEANTTAITQNYATLTQSINAEAQTRSTNDQALQSAITTVDDKFELYYPKTDVYNKTEIDDKVTTINTSIGGEESSRIAADDNLQTQINAKANTNDVYNKTSVDTLLASKADTSTTYTKTEVDGLLDDKADTDDVYDKTEVYTKTETYNKEEVDELIEEAGGGTTYTDKIIVGTNLTDNADLGQPTAIFGQFNNGNQGYLSVGSGSISIYGQVEIINECTPKDEYHTTYTKTINYPNFLNLLSTKGFLFSLYYATIIDDNNNAQLIGSGDWNQYTKGYKFTITFDENYQFTTKCVWVKTNQYTEFDILIEYDINTSDLTITVTSSREVKLLNGANNFILNAYDIDKRDALVVKADGKTYINETGNSTNLYAIQDKFNSQQTSINTISDAVSTIPNIEIISETDYDNYLYHDPMKTYMIAEDEDLTSYKNEYFNIECTSYNSNININSLQNYGSFEYSTDKTTWNTLSTSSFIAANRKVYFRGTINQGASTTTCPFKITNSSYHKSIKISGNIMSLIYGDNFQNQTSLADYPHIFSGFFNTISFAIDASKLILPATTLSNNCYGSMFNGCSKLYYGPKELPATTLASYCYYQMFKGCTNLINPVSILPATSIVNSNSYYEMYKNCTSITKTPSIRLTSGSLNQTDMFTDCTKLKYIEIMLVLSFYYNGLSQVFPSTNSSIVSPSYFVFNENCTFGDNYNMPAGWTKVYITPPTNS